MRIVRTFREEERIYYLQLWQESGLSQCAFCEEQGLNLRTFSNWKTSRLTKGQSAKDLESTGFIPLPVSSFKPKEKATIRIGVGRYQIVVDEFFDSAVLNEVLSVLEARDVY